MMVTALHMTGLDGGSVPIPSPALDALASRVKGGLLQPETAGYDDAVRIWNGMIAKRPALVLQPASVEDVRHAVDFARTNGVLLSVKGGGHHIAGLSLADGGLTLDMSRMRTVEVDPADRTARVGAGCLLGDVDRVTQEHGLATVLGSDADTGVAGLTLGGGFGYLTRRFGWTVDNLEAAEIVTADGVARRVSAVEHGDLFWALRGGGGNYGVVTDFTFRLHQVGPMVTGGLILWSADDTDEVLAAYRDVSASAPRELALVLTMRQAPAAPFLPERWHGTPVIGIIACHTGDLDAAKRDLAQIRAAGTPIVDLIVQKRYVDQQYMLAAPQPRGLHYYWKSEFLSDLTDAFLDTFARQTATVTSPLSQVILFQLGGALGDREVGTTAIGNRDAEHIVFAAGCWPPDSPDPGRHREWVRSAWSAVRPYSTGGNYVNVQTADEDDDRTRAAYGPGLDRLAQVKAAYDPANLFRVNRNISPTAI